MTEPDLLLQQRLCNQRLINSEFQNPSEVVDWLCAAQAQDYPAAKWGLGLRAGAMCDADVDRAFNDGTILRTHVLRPTWHFITPADIRWLIALTGPRVLAIVSHYERRVELDPATLKRSRAVLEKVLDGTSLTRQELAAALRRARIGCDGLRLVFLVMNAELNGVTCSGPLRGKQFTYALMDQRVPPGRVLTHEEAVSELTRRYFASHGPATIRDFVWWSGLTVSVAKQGVRSNQRTLENIRRGELTYWFAPASTRRPRKVLAHLLPNYDEFLIGYQDRQLTAPRKTGQPTARQQRDPFTHYLIVDGRLAGTWKRTIKKDRVQVSIARYRSFRRAESSAIADAAERYGRFLRIDPICEVG